MRKEVLSWDDVDKLIDVLTPQFRGGFEAMVMITRGGIIPGGLIAEALDVKHILTAAVRFTMDLPGVKLAAWPDFLQFPDDHLLEDRRTLVVDDVWGSGRTITTVRNHVGTAGGSPSTCVLHFNPYRNLFSAAKPDYYAAVTDAHIIYPWEIKRGPDLALLDRTPHPSS